MKLSNLSKSTLRRAPLWQWVLTALLLAAYTAAMLFLHYKQLLAAWSGDGLYDSDLVMHMAMSISGNGAYSLIVQFFHPVYLLGGYPLATAYVTAFHLAAVFTFAYCLRTTMPQWITVPSSLAMSVMCNVASAVYIPRGGYWFLGTIFNPIYHNTTYTGMLPFALLTLLGFVRIWPTRAGKISARKWLFLCFFATVCTLQKANYIIAFAPALLLLLIGDLCKTKGKNLKNEVILGATVLPSILVALLQMTVLEDMEDPAEMTLIFLVDFDRHKMPMGPFNEPGVLGLLRSFVFVGLVFLLFFRAAWQRQGYRFSLLVLCVTLTEAMLFVETEPRLYHGNFWWGSYVCFFLFFLESLVVWLQELAAWRSGQRGAALGARVLVCGAALCWHIVSGLCFLVMLLEGKSYNIPILTFKIWPFSG